MLGREPTKEECEDNNAVCVEGMQYSIDRLAAAARDVSDELYSYGVQKYLRALQDSSPRSVTLAVKKALKYRLDRALL